MSAIQSLSTLLLPSADLLTGLLVGCSGLGLLALLPLGFVITKHEFRQHPNATSSWSIRVLVSALALLGIGAVGHLELQLLPPSDIARFLGAVTAISALVGCGAGLIGAVVVVLETGLSSLRRR